MTREVNWARIDATLARVQGVVREADRVIDRVRARLIAEGQLDPNDDKRAPIERVYQLGRKV